jgi:hypothetical protein
LQVDSIVDGTIEHAWILARIATIFKTVELALARVQGANEPSEWHTFVAGCAAGYYVMGPVTSRADYRLKQQVTRLTHVVAHLLTRSHHPCQ